MTKVDVKKALSGISADYMHSQIEAYIGYLLAYSLEKIYGLNKISVAAYSVSNDGFTYDFEKSEDLSINASEFKKIEKEIKKAIGGNVKINVEKVTKKEALEICNNSKYLTIKISEYNDSKELYLYKVRDFICDVSSEPYTSSIVDLKPAIKLLTVSGAYWQGNEKNAMLTRITGVAFQTEEELSRYLNLLEESKKRDHRKLGQDLGLFVFSETVGKGLPLWTPKGATVRRILERFIVDEEIKRGYLHVYTPDIANLNLYKKSGHYPYYKDTMYAPIVIDDEEYMLRPMTCPHHFELYLSSKHSYKELPMRIAELAQLYRYEKSGELAGLLRVRTFCLADAHIIARKDQAESEISGVLDLIEYITETFGLKPGLDYSYRLSLGNRNDTKKYYKDDTSWDYAENVLRKVLNSRNVPYREAEDEAAFYGPKIDIQMKNVLGKEDTAFTVQYDFVMPKRFDLKYINESNEEIEPIVVHRSSIGAIERVMAFLIEHFAGAFPLWLAPVQAVVIPISQDLTEYASTVYNKLKLSDLRVENWNESGSMQNKIRLAEKQKIPYMIIIGKTELENNTISLRRRGSQQSVVVKLEDFLKKIKEENASHSL